MQTSDYSDKVSLKDIWDMLRSSRAYFDQMGFKRSQELSQKLRNKGLTLSTVAGLMYLRYFKVKEGDAGQHDKDGDDDLLG